MPKPSIPVRCVHLRPPFNALREYEVTIAKLWSGQEMRVLHLCAQCGEAAKVFTHIEPEAVP